MLNFFKKEKDLEKNNISIISLASLLIHVAKIDENYSDKEKIIIEKTLIDIGVEAKDLKKIIEIAEKNEQNSNQILDFTRDIKAIDENFKIKIIESLWKIIFSDNNPDMYESNLMRRLSGLLYLDNKLVGNIKEKVKKDLDK